MTVTTKPREGGCRESTHPPDWKIDPKQSANLSYIRGITGRGSKKLRNDHTPKESYSGGNRATKVVVAVRMECHALECCIVVTVVWSLNHDARETHSRRECSGAPSPVCYKYTFPSSMQVKMARGHCRRTCGAVRAAKDVYSGSCRSNQALC